ncbi:MAG: mycofactocin biosynthesis glycosyltransferase MftF [Syntrophobacteraceae bacterium]|nr:mycofactocin biosynthesis glycosyltransferase MftF [Syntrophobacteraceae bacterium]
MVDKRTTEKFPGTFTLVPAVRLIEGEAGGVILRLSPLKAVKVNGAAFKILKRCEAGFTPEDGTGGYPGQESFLDAMCAAQVVRWTPSGEAAPPFVTIIVPVFNRAGEVGECLKSLLRLNYPPDRREIVVVDDGSTDNTAEVARSCGDEIKVLVQKKNLGQSAARNVGIAAAAGEIVAFIDSDCIADPNWLNDLTPWFEDPRIALVGGFVDSYFRESRLDRYEEARSPLNMGKHVFLCHSTDSDFYVPTCNMLVRKSACLMAGGLDESLRVGEDVDLCWKLKNLGHRLVYVPQGSVRHKHRNRFWPAFKRRFDYGTSEPILYDRHREVTKRFPCRLSALFFLGSCCAGLVARPLFSLFFAMGVAVSAALRNRSAIRKKTGIGLSFFTILGATLKNFEATGYYLGLHFVRYYLLLSFALMMFFPSAAPLWLALVIFPVALEYGKLRPRLSFPVFMLYFAAEQVFYQMGVFSMCCTMRSFRCYRLSFGKKQKRGSAPGLSAASPGLASCPSALGRRRQ